MASFDQDLIIFEDDTLLLRYTFTDLELPFSSNESVFWSAWSYDDWTGARTGSASSQSPISSGGPDIYKADTWTTATGGTLTPANTGGISVVNGDVIVEVNFTQADFNATTAGTLATDTEYYTELVLSNNGSENTSLVTATGKLFISSSMFSIAGYRP
jgi:hypothetical protein